MYDQLTATIKTLSDIPDNQIPNLIRITQIRNIKANEYFILAGETPTKFAFNLHGLFRYFYNDKNGNEYTKAFFPENTFISSYSAMIQQRESYFTVEALEDAIILQIDYQDWKALLRASPGWNSFLVAILEQGYCNKELREREFLLFDATTRYQIFLEKFPDLTSRVKMHLIASYLGITPVALSRIRKKMGLIT